MIRTALAISALSLAIPAQAAEIQIPVSGPVVELTVTESVKQRPDIATVGAGVTSEAGSAVEALRQNSRAMAAVISQIKALGIDEDDIQTTGINLNARYDYDRASERQVFRGYQVSNRVSVILRDIEETGAVLDALVAAGATDLNGPSFSIDDETGAKAQARAAALKQVEAQARQYAEWSGYAGVRLLEISEAIHTTRPQPMMRTMDVAEEAAALPPVQPGMVASAVTVTVKYEMTR